MGSLAADRWRALSPYLDEALDLPVEARGPWLAALRERAPELVDDLRGCLAGALDAEDAGFLDGVALPPPSPSLAGQRIGAYRLVSIIGEGGSGSVWLADRCDGHFRGRAAVKLLNLALAGPAGEERFRREGTILARLRHPRIAHLIDAGVSLTGQPYLVLEHVDGETIERYCDIHALDVEARLRLFLDVLDAVSFAHANLTVHRDIKPANVLVSAEGHVTLLDFGIAKLIDTEPGWHEGRSAEAVALTREIGRALTPEYASPEQLAGGAVTTATDVYALGVLLYVLLSGRHPAGSAVRSPATLIRSIVEEVPLRPSDAADDTSHAWDLRVQHAARFGTTPARLRRALTGDLDTIVARALKKDPAERYGSVEALAEDVRRALRQEPISARPDTLGYRTLRFAQRHVTAVVTAMTMVALVSVMTAVYTTRLAAERDRARREAAKAVKVSEMLMSMLTSADPYTVRTGGEPTVRALLDGGAARVQQELVAEPELQAELLTTMGRTYRRLGQFDKAAALLDQALTSGTAAFGPEHVRVAQTLHDLGVVQADRGQWAAATRSLEEALAMRRRLLGASHADVAVTLAELGRVYQDLGDADLAIEAHREALAIRRTTLGERHRETAVSLSDLASVHRLAGHLDDAERLLRLSLSINRETRGERHPNTAVTLHDLALITAARGDLRGAHAQLRDVITRTEAALGPRHPVVAAAWHNLARVASLQGSRQEATVALQRALDIAGGALGHQHQLYAIYAIDLATLHAAAGREDLAAPLLTEGRHVRAQAPGVVPSRRRSLGRVDMPPAPGVYVTRASHRVPVHP
ncbi:MAG TPA: serine/threonine-protein kinase [Luteitalea sp.]|nr:serine/threonine-protein kinase [Luteitalea sp.]